MLLGCDIYLPFPRRVTVQECSRRLVGPDARDAVARSRVQLV